MAQPVTHIRFSVVIPVYNGAATIRRTLNSVLNQSVPPWQVIVSDDASTDNTCALIRQEYADRVLLLTTTQNAGSSAARNRAMDSATGDYVAFIDADDLWHPEKLRTMQNILLSSGPITLLYHRYTLQDILSTPQPPMPPLRHISFAALLPANRISTSCAVVRNDPSFRFHPSMRYTEDYDLWLRISYRHGATFADVALTQLLRGITTPGGISSNKWRMRKGELKAYARLVHLHILFVFLIPLLWITSLAKHLAKLIR